MQLLTTFAVTTVVSSGFEHDDVAGNDLANLTVSTHRAGLMKQLFFSDSGKRNLLTWSR